MKNEGRSLCFWNVSFMATPDDNGCCVTFNSESIAKDFVQRLKDEGCYHVLLWKE